MTERERMLRRLSSLDFAAAELHIYLDTHPDDNRTADILSEYRSQRDAVRREYEEKYGPLSSMNEDGNRWAWISDPWPWDNQEV